MCQSGPWALTLELCIALDDTSATLDSQFPELLGGTGCVAEPKAILG